ncbi:ATP-grasp domain-containing protein [Thiobacillus denitrificans]|uniref:ATP-grasp domain-containing protein n=1 Tax=Thiobacillus denitrificans TaxID=36861 RepID=UPI00037DECAE|nr:ATP-grasp domain-containing protein [Thiobacillus denitrificans]
MKVFVFEFVTGGGYAGQALPGFLGDGELMWRALVDDLIALPGMEVLTLRDARLAIPEQPGLTVVATDATRCRSDFMRCLDAADAAWMVAPESGGLLESLNRQVEAAGKWLLGCRPDAVHIAASKYATTARLAGAGVTTVPTFATPDLLTGAVVAKPDDGVGCEDTLLFADAAAAQAWHDTHPHAMHVFQPYVAGESLSLSLLCCDGRTQLLSVNRQHVGLTGDHFEFHGVTVNALGDGDGRYAALAARVAAAIPGLWGYVGVDLIAGAFGPMVLEVNPRATVSYAGLRAALDCNPAQHVLELPEMHACRGLRPITLETTHV